jgi:TonB family protein
MERLGIGGVAQKARFAGVIAGIMILAGGSAAHAQASPPAGNSIDQAPSEAARRAALSPYRFILQNASAPVRKPAAAPSPAPAAPSAPSVAERKPAPAAVQQAAAQPTAPAVQKPVAAATPASAASAEAAVASLSRQPVEPPPPPPRLEIIPVSTEEPRLSAALLREHPKGVVKVHFDIQPDGSVSQVQVMASTNRSLNRPSVDAVQKWKFEPVDAVLTVETELVYKFDE